MRVAITNHAGRLVAGIHVAPLLAVLLWGGIYPATKVGLRDFPVLSFTALRVLLAAVALVFLIGGARGLRLPRGLRRATLNAGCAQATFQLLLIAGLGRTSAANSAILLATAPLLTTLWLVVTAREHPMARGWLGLVIGLAGVVLVIRGGADASGAGRLTGDLIALSAAGAWVWYSLAVAPLVPALGPVRATAWSLLLATALIVPVALVQLATRDWAAVSLPAWVALLYCALAGLVAASALWAAAIGRLGARRTMIYIYLEPVSAVLLAALLLGEALTPVQGAGAVLALLGVWLAGG